ncbi:MAG: UDP-N-acetylglucosamine 2-epimerase (non-hydrolyzing) [Candidatus Marinimicrobia bacterium]|nr:UDP-N-acetylglucosamine 2-epimerase (non-hydrolyzing) [Candidatus Neomarinimicrobiota bacterium]|tara:strand:- start:3866 stop:4960 length:1095 start_codon:yes stop_codon:yes gene_type:complete
MKIDIIAGARPNFIKIAPIINQINLIKKKKTNLSYRLIHTGQHYDDEMSNIFFNQLSIPKPNVNLDVGSSTHAKQTADIMVGYEQIIKKARPDVCLVVGDVNSTMACAIVAKKEKIKVAHVEAGIRSFDSDMPEEINRIVTDSISDYYFTTSETANMNLKNLGVRKSKIFFVGNVMIDTLLSQLPHLKKPLIFNKLCLSKKKYFVLTLHRPSNVDDEKKLLSVLKVINNNVNNLKVLFPAHPRTKKVLNKSKINLKNIYQINPMSYLEFNYLVKNSLCILTDSGGITEETTVMNIPCITLRENTERPETVKYGTNELVGTNQKKIILSLNKVLTHNWKKGSTPELWDGKSSYRIINHLISLNEK